MEQAAPIRRNPLRAVIKAILHVFVKIIVLARRAVLRRPIVALVLAIMLIGGYFAIDTGLVSLNWLGLPARAYDPRPPAVAQFITGQQEGNVQLMWEAMADQLKQNQEAFQTAQQNVTFAKLNNISVTDAAYVGGQSLSDGTSVHFVVMSLSNGTRTVQVPRTFVLDQAGKISDMK